MSKFTPNTFQCPNALVDQYAEILSGNAFKCMTIIIRKTRGWHKDSDSISHSSFKGMSTNTAKSALKELVELGLINQLTHQNRPATYSLTDFFDAGISKIDTQYDSRLSEIDMCVSKIDTQNDSCLSKTDMGESKIDTQTLSKIDPTKNILLKDTNKKEREARTRKSKTTLPENFGISADVREWADSHGHTHIEAHLESFIDKAKSKGYEYSDWDAAFREAIRKNWAGVGQQPKNTNQHQHQQQSYSSCSTVADVEASAQKTRAKAESQSAFSGIDLIKFKELQAKRPSITQAEIKELARKENVDVLTLMIQMIKAAAKESV